HPHGGGRRTHGRMVGSVDGPGVDGRARRHHTHGHHRHPDGGVVGRVCGTIRADTRRHPPPGGHRSTHHRVVGCQRSPHPGDTRRDPAHCGNRGRDGRVDGRVLRSPTARGAGAPHTLPRNVPNPHRTGGLMSTFHVK